ncbi:phage terminase small subunit P27 family [Enterobacter roggenkampii]|uniref:phage terminase small subunit P27 family n=1 Tax=Enterobacter roggenkampii TaxID=1812935 RepID=UPI001F230DA6|nr:phage terminase small subunit P27 family [Enterobacter roggenkampii]
MPGVTGRSGRRPKPTARKELAGNPGKRALNKQEPQFTPITSAEPPEWFDDVARQMWETVIKELCNARVLYVTDLHNVVLFCSAFRNWHKAQEEIIDRGITVETEFGPKKNPAMTAANECMRQIATFGSLLGLDPASRQRLITPKTTSSNPFSNL